MEVTLCSMEVAASASVIAVQVGMVPCFGCGCVHGVSLAAVHQIPHDEDGGIMALRDRCDTSKGAGGWRKRQISKCSSVLLNVCHYFELT